MTDLYWRIEAELQPGLSCGRKLLLACGVAVAMIPSHGVVLWKHFGKIFKQGQKF